MSLITQESGTGFDAIEFEEWVRRYADFHQHGYDLAYCRKWARFHYEIYLKEGVRPDFMRRA